MKAVFKVSYYLRSNYKNKEGKSPIIIRIFLNGKMCNIGSSGLSINPKKWDSKHSRMKGKTAEALNLNYQLDNITTSLNTIFNKINLENSESLSVEKIKSIYTGYNNQVNTFLEVFQSYNDDLKKLIGKTKSRATYQKYERAKEHFRKFLLKKYNRKDIKLTELAHSTIHDFEIYLKTTGRCSHNTTAKTIQYIRTISLFAKNNGLMNNDPFQNYKITFQKVDRGYLNDNEIKKIIQKKITIPRLEKVRDIFVFACFTGLAYIDVENLTTNNLIENEGQYWIMTKRKKTNIISNILLLDIPMNIIKKYEKQRKGNKLLPILSNQKMNSYLKEIATICGINKNLTFHLARHTFATTVTLAKGMPIETVSKMLGHTNIKTTQIYARITTEKIEKEMLSLADKLKDYSVN